MNIPKDVLRTRIAIAAVFLVMIVAAVITRAEWNGAAQRTIASLRSHGAPAYFGAMAVLPAVGFPLSAFVVAAGPLFAPVLGIWRVGLYAILALMAADVLSYAMGAFVLRGFASSLAAKAGFLVPELRHENAWKITFVVRILPGFPFFFKSCLLGAAGISFGACLVASMIVQSVLVLSVIFLGGGIVSGDRTSLIVAGILFIIISCFCHAIRKSWKKAKPLGGGAAGMPRRGAAKTGPSDAA